MQMLEKLSREEQRLISNTVYPTSIDLEHAWYLLENVKDLFGPAPHALREYEAEQLWHVIELAENTIYDALTYFYLLNGNNDWPGVKAFKRSAQIVLEQQKEAAFGVGAPKRRWGGKGLTTCLPPLGYHRIWRFSR